MVIGCQNQPKGMVKKYDLAIPDSGSAAFAAGLKIL